MMRLASGMPIRVCFVSSPSMLPVVRAAVEKACELIGFTNEEAGGIVLSVDEAVTNIIRHAYNGAEDKPIELELAALSDGRTGGLKICLRDHGKGVDQSRIRGRDLSDVRPGGLGVHIMTQCMDRVTYAPADGGGTLLTMVKRLPCAV